MSSPSTPRSTQSASPTGGSPEILTPGRKVKAMLAQFDSDSESEHDDKSTAQGPIPKLNLTNDTSTNEPTREGRRTNADSDSDEEGEEDDDIIMPKGRMAARMQAGTQNGNTNESNTTKTETAFERLSKRLRAEKEGSKSQDQDQDQGNTVQHGSDKDDDGDGAMQSSDDDLPMAGPRRNLAKGNKQPEVMEEPDRSPSRTRSFSPLFMSSPIMQRDNLRDHDGSDGSGEDEPQPKDNARLRALVAQKRKEREQRERIEAEKKKAARAAKNEQFSSEVLSGGESDDDGSSGRKLTQQSRPSRKASKKAMEEMNRETQRISRNMQLAHQAQTKKKITKESFFSRFNFGQPKEQTAPGLAAENSSGTAGSQNSSDVEAHKDRETPRTSPVLGPADKLGKKPMDGEVAGAGAERETESLLPVEDLFSEINLRKEEPVVARAEVQTKEPHPATSEIKAERKSLKKTPVRVQVSRQSVAQYQQEDSDSDLEVITSPAKCRRIAAFENLPSKKMEEPESVTMLKALAHLTSPTRQRGSTNFAQISAGLLAQARQQSARERKERIEELKAKGITIETAEERAAMEDEVENLVDKARKEADDIGKQERKESKNGREGGEDDDDADFELSGSEGEEAYGDPDEEEDEEEDAQADIQDGAEGLIEADAREDENSGDDQIEAMSADEADEADMPTARRKRPTRVVSDDEDDEEPQAPTTSGNPITPRKNFAEQPEFPNMPGSHGLAMGLTQAFAGTLGGSQQGSLPNSPAPIPTLPDPQLMAGDTQTDSQMIIKDSQGQPPETADIFAGYAPSDARVSESPAFRAMSEFSQVPEPTQDAGFTLSPFDPLKRFMDIPPSTVETVLVGQDKSQESPVPQRKGKHLRRGRADDSNSGEEQSKGDFEIDTSAFDVLKRANKKNSSVPFDKQKSKAKDVVEDAAEESDDEYAGIGGASDYSDDEENAYDREMINDNSGEKVDGKQLAALNAVQERDADEKRVAQLFRDITTGGLRRRKGADDDLDLDDPADELLARRREKQREFARMRNALLADDKVNEIAENPKKAAFFKAIEDRDEEDDVDLDFLEYEKEEEPSSQDVGSEGQQGSTAPESNDDNKRKRPLEPSAEDIANRPPPHLRRTPASAMSKKPATLAEIRETLSFLTETHDYDSFQEDAAIEAEEHAEQMEVDETDSSVERPAANDFREDSAPPTHNHPRRTRGPVVDRLALLRQASSNSATSASASTRFAFQAGSGKDAAASIGFRPPQALRKMSTGSSSSSTSSSSDPRRAVKASATGAGTKKGAVNYYTAAREKEREREIRSKERSSGSNIAALLNKHASNRLGSLGKGQWE